MKECMVVSFTACFSSLYLETHVKLFKMDNPALARLCPPPTHKSRLNFMNAFCNAKHPASNPQPCSSNFIPQKKQLKQYPPAKFPQILSVIYSLNEFLDFLPPSQRKNCLKRNYSTLVSFYFLPPSTKEKPSSPKNLALMALGLLTFSPSSQKKSPTNVFLKLSRRNGRFFRCYLVCLPALRLLQSR